MSEELKQKKEMSIVDTINRIKRKEHTDKVSAIFELSIVYTHLYRKKIRLLNLFSNKNKKSVSIAEDRFVQEWHKEYNFVRSEIGHIIRKNRRAIEDSKLKVINFHGDDVGKKTLAMHLMCERFRKHKHPKK